MSSSDFGTIFQIGNILVSEDILTEFFCCDYARCKGACCIVGDSGAPLEEAEPELLEAGYSAYSRLMRPEGRCAVRKDGFFMVDRDGDLVTPLAADSGECAYTARDGQGGCFCSIERCFLEGSCKFRKPQSCRLYPVRVVKLTGGGLALNLHRWHLCKDAYRKGREEGTRVYEFLREPLTGIFGEDFYSALSEAARRFIAAS